MVKKRRPFLTTLYRAFEAAAEETDLGQRLFGEEASPGLQRPPDPRPPLRRGGDEPAVRRLQEACDRDGEVPWNEYPDAALDMYVAFILGARTSRRQWPTSG